MEEDATSKKFLVSQFNNYMMVDSRSVMEQFNEIERMLGNFKQHNMNMDETIIVSSIVDKLPLGWKDFKRSLKHKKEDVSLVELANSLRVEEGLRKQEGGGMDRNIHVVEEGQSSKRHSYKDKGKGKMPIQSNDKKRYTPYGKDKQSKIACWICNGPHMKKDCPKRKGGACSSRAGQ